MSRLQIKYKRLKKIGEGAQATVYATAYQDRSYAIKVASQGRGLEVRLGAVSFFEGLQEEAAPAHTKS